MGEMQHSPSCSDSLILYIKIQGNASFECVVSSQESYVLCMLFCKHCVIDKLQCYSLSYLKDLNDINVTIKLQRANESKLG